MQSAVAAAILNIAIPLELGGLVNVVSALRRGRELNSYLTELLPLGLRLTLLYASQVCVCVCACVWCVVWCVGVGVGMCVVCGVVCVWRVCVVWCGHVCVVCVSNMCVCVCVCVQPVGCT